MSKRFSLQILLPIEGYEEDKIYKSEEIALTAVNLKRKPNDVWATIGKLSKADPSLMHPNQNAR